MPVKGPRRTEAAEALVRPIVEQLVLLRTAAGLSQGELARRAGYDVRNMTRIFAPRDGRRRVDIDTLERLARPLGVRVVLDLVPLNARVLLFKRLPRRGAAPETGSRWHPEIKPIARLTRPVIRALRRLREAHGLTLEDVGFVAEMDPRNVSRVLLTHEGSRHVDLDSLDRIARAFGCRPVLDLIPASAPFHITLDQPAAQLHFRRRDNKSARRLLRSTS